LIKASEPELKRLASIIVQTAPAGIVQASERLAMIAECIVSPRPSVDVQDALEEVKQGLLGGVRGS
jgi:hypothetical protein